MPVLFTADQSHADKTVGLLTDVQGSPLRARLVDTTLADSPYDHVVRTMADLPAPVGGPPGLINLTAGSWAFPVDLNIGNNIIVVPGLTECHLKGFWGKFLTGTATNLIAVNGIAFLDTMVLSNDAPLLCSGVGAICVCQECDIIAISACILTTVAFGHLQVVGGYWQQFAGTPAGLYVNCDVGNIQVLGVRTVNLDRAIRWVAGVVGGCQVEGCSFFGGVGSIGIDWAPASMPTRGLYIVGNDFEVDTPLQGFNPAAALVNAKANSARGVGLFTETAIVP